MKKVQLKKRKMIIKILNNNYYQFNQINYKMNY
jgi:hypothetical protein